jgi:peptide/histidine transporter 3/4
LDKAATEDGSTSPWKLCPVTQVEETKLMLRMLPVWVTLFIPSTLISHVSTLFIKQGTTLNRHMGSHFQIPAGSLTSFFALSMVVSIIVYEKVLVRIFRRFTGNPRGITILQRMGIGIFVHMVSMAVASVTDVKRINVVKAHGLEGEAKAVSPLTVFILLPQFLLGGIAEAFLETAKLEFFYDQAPRVCKA